METVKLFFELIRYAIKGDSLSEKIKASVNDKQLSELFLLSKKHDVTPMVSYALNQNGLIQKDNEIHKRFLQEQSFAVFRYENIDYELNKVIELFEKHGIMNIPLKGSVIRSLYPEPWMRTSGDIDILIKNEDSARATKVLTEEYGCKKERIYDYEIAFLMPSNVHLELHLGLVAERESDAVVEVLSNVWGSSRQRENYVYSKRMSDEIFYFYHLSHMAKHFFASGCGVRPFIDLWLLDNVGNNNLQNRLNLLEIGQLTRFYEASKKVVDSWMTGANNQGISLEIEEFVLQAGVYGTKENWKLYHQHKKGGKFRYALSRIFLSYEELNRYYPTLKKHKWLKPFYQVRRWFRILFCGGLKRSAKELKEIKNLSTEQIEKRENMMKNLGLWH